MVTDLEKVKKNLEKRGHYVSIAHQYGSDFLVYEDSTDKHSKWLVWVLAEGREDISVLTLIALARIAHTVNKELLFALPLGRGGVKYWKINEWK